VAQFGVIFILFALGLEFSMTKVGLFFVLSPFLFFVMFMLDLTLITLITLLSIYMLAASSCSICCCSWWLTSDFSIYVHVWFYCIGMFFIILTF
jgi:hypothetical protein